MFEASRFLISERFRFDLATRELFRIESDGSATFVPLGSRAADVLLLFLRRPGELLTKNEIMGEVWPNTAVEDNNLRVQISTLRQILDAERGGASAISTVPGRGYRFTLPVQIEEQPKTNPSRAPADVRTLDPDGAQSGQNRLAARLRVGGVIALLMLLTLSGTAFVVRYLSPSSPNLLPPALAGVDHGFDPARVPLVTDRVRSRLTDYPGQPDFKAIAISRVGWGVSVGLPDPLAAERDALDRCRKSDSRNGDCRIYAVGDKLVAPRLPIALPADIHPEPLDIPLLSDDVRLVRGMPSGAGLDTFNKGNNHKELALSSDGANAALTDRPDRAEAIRLAVERCSDCKVALSADIRRRLSDRQNSALPRRGPALHAGRGN
jgi:DNA-binding winged helix-turn-helix (wHTH) protein